MRIRIELSTETHDCIQFKLLRMNEKGVYELLIGRGFYDVADALSAFALCSKLIELLKEDKS